MVVYNYRTWPPNWCHASLSLTSAFLLHRKICMELTRAACAQRRQNKSDAQHMHWAMRSCKGRDCLQKSVFGTWYDHWGSAQRIRRKRHVQREGENPNRSKIVASLSWAPPSQRKLGWIQYVEMDLCDFCMKARLFFHLFRTKLIIYIYIYTKSRCSIRASASFQCFSFGTCSHASRLIGPGQTLVLSTIKSFRRWSSSGVTRLLNSTAPTHALSVSQFFKKATERLKEVHELLRARRDSANLSPGLQDLWICLWNVGTLAEKNRKVVKKGFFRKRSL